MCGTCGCGEDNSVTIRKPGEDAHTHYHTHADGSVHSHSHNHDDHHHHHHDDNLAFHKHEHSRSIEIKLEQDILHKNNLLAERNRGYFEAKDIFAINLVSSPGSGKTSLLEKTIKDKKSELDFFIIEGDQHTMNDAQRIHEAGAPAIQINTGQGCHLDAEMVNKAVKQLEVKEKSILVIENVGNLVCPAMFDLGETKRVVIISTPEGEDKPIKYPEMFRTSNLCLINKIDLLPFLDFDIQNLKNYALQVNHHIEFIEISVKTGEGMQDWYNWLNKNLKK